MGYDTKSRVQKITIGASSQPSDIWVDYKLVKEVYSDTTRVYNAPVYIQYASNNFCDYLYLNQLKFTTKLGSTVCGSGTITSSNWDTSTYAHPMSVNGTRLGYYGIDVGYGATVTWEISGVEDGYGVFNLNSKTKSITYSGSTVNNANNDFFYATLNPIDVWGIKPVIEKTMNKVYPFTNNTTTGIAINSSAFPDHGQESYIYIQPRWWTDWGEDGGNDCWWYPRDSYTISDDEIGVPQNSKGYLTMQFWGVYMGNIGAGKHIPYRVYSWSNGYYFYDSGGSTSYRATDNGYQFSVTVGTDVSNPYGNESRDGFDYVIRDVWSDDDGNVFANIDLDIGFSSGKSSDYDSFMDEDRQGYGGALYIGTYHKNESDSLNTLLKSIWFQIGVYYG